MKVASKYMKILTKKALLVLPLLSAFAVIPEYAHAAGPGDVLGDFFDGLLGGADAVAGDVLGGLSDFFHSIGLGGLFDDFAGYLFGAGDCGQQVTGGVGDVMCNVVNSSALLPGLISGIAYGSGLILAVTAMLKLKEHVINPDRTPLSDSMKRLVAGGAFFSLPSVTSAVKSMVGGDTVASYQQTGGFAGSVSASGGLDSMITMLVADIWEPLQILLGSFAYLAGLVLVVVGIGRLIKTSQEGPRGPSGMGTIMTFVTAGVLFSLDSLMGAFSSSLFATNDVATYAVLNSSTGDTAVDSHIEGVISAVTAFMALVGWISFIRGFFILREVAEGNGQASLMAATTHMFGGALAVNLGPLINAVQSTFGLTPFGVSFYT